MLGIQQLESYRKFLFQYTKISVNLNVKNVSDFNNQIWSYYESKKREKDGKEKMVVENDKEIIMFLPSICEEGDSFFNQILHFSENYHVISVDSYPNFVSQEQWCDSFHKFVKHISKQVSGDEKRKIHICACEFSGFLVQFYAEKFPEYVASLILVNAYVNSSHFTDSFSYVGYYGYFPRFLLRRWLSDGISSLNKSGSEKYKRVAEFLTNKVNSFSPEKILSKLKLKSERNVIRHIENRNIMIMETYDSPALVPTHLLEMMYNFYPNATKGKMKRGKDFPYLTEPDDFNLYIGVFLRRFSALEEGEQHDVILTASVSGEKSKPKLAPRRVQRLQEERDSVEEEEIEKYFNVINTKLVHGDTQGVDDSPGELEYVDLQETPMLDQIRLKSSKSPKKSKQYNDEYSGYEQKNEVDEDYFDELLEYTGVNL